MRRVSPWLGVLLALILLPAVPVSGAPNRKVVSPGGHWTLDVPADWRVSVQAPDAQFAESVRLIGTGKLFVEAKIYRENPPLDALVAKLKRDFTLRGVDIDTESQPVLHGHPAFRFELLQGPRATRLRMRHVIIDGKTRKVLLTTVFPEPPAPEAMKAFEDLLASMDIPEAPVPPAPPALEQRSFPEQKLVADVPAGAEVTLAEDELRAAREDLGLSLSVRWLRTTLSAGQVADYALGSGGGAKFEIADRREIQIGERPAVAIRSFELVGKLRVATRLSLVHATGPEEVAVLTYASVGESPFESLSALEGALARIQAGARFAAAPSAAPALTTATTVWEGRAAVRLPAGWAPTADPPLPAGFHEAKRCCAPQADDLSVEFLVFPSGKLEFEAWLTEQKFDSAQGPRLSAARPLGVGGLAGHAWDLEYGPPGDRWTMNVVAVFGRQRGFAILTRTPIRLQAALGGLAEKIAETVEFKR